VALREIDGEDRVTILQPSPVRDRKAEERGISR